jgi:Mn-containing catalase
MADKPSYLGLLNTVALAESAAHEYLEAWIAVTPSDDVRCVLQAVSAREGEHGKAFAKRINELGYTLRPKDDPRQADRTALVQRTDLSDLEKMENLVIWVVDTCDVQ